MMRKIFLSPLFCQWTNYIPTGRSLTGMMTLIISGCAGEVGLLSELVHDVEIDAAEVHCFQSNGRGDRVLQQIYS